MLVNGDPKQFPIANDQRSIVNWGLCSSAEFNDFGASPTALALI